MRRKILFIVLSTLLPTLLWAEYLVDRDYSATEYPLGQPPGIEIVGESYDTFYEDPLPLEELPTDRREVQYNSYEQEYQRAHPEADLEYNPYENRWEF